MSIPPERPSPLVPGYRLDRYELLCPIAQGGMASVWIARLIGKHGFEKLVAIKTILPQFASDHRFQRMFLDEAHIASGIEHVNVAQILDLGEQHDILYIVMEWVDGDALSKLHRAVEKKNLAIPPQIVLRVLADACGGLHAAHELRDREGRLLNVVHRDVSPQNILVSTKGIAKIIDFGIAKARDRMAGDTNAGVLKGKIQYMAPEQAVGKPIDRRADVWAVGAILYHLLSGKPPFDGPNQLATLHRLTSGRPPLPLPDRIPKPLADLVRRGLAQDPDKRIATAAEMQSELEAVMDQCSLRATAADVAAFLREHLSERADARKKAIDLALKAAAERARMQQVLQMPGPDTSSGITNLPARLASIPQLDEIAPSPASEPPTTHAVITGSTDSGAKRPSLSDAEPARRPTKRIALIAGGAAGLVLLAIVLLRVAGAGRDEPSMPAATGEAKSAAAPVKPAANAIATESAPSLPSASTTTPEPPSPTLAPAVAPTHAPAVAPPVAAKPTAAPAKATTQASAAKPTKPKPTGGDKPIDDGF